MTLSARDSLLTTDAASPAPISLDRYTGTGSSGPSSRLPEQALDLGEPVLDDDKLGGLPGFLVLQDHQKPLAVRVDGPAITDVRTFLEAPRKQSPQIAEPEGRLRLHRNGRHGRAVVASIEELAAVG